MSRWLFVSDVWLLRISPWHPLYRSATTILQIYFVFNRKLLFLHSRGWYLLRLCLQEELFKFYKNYIKNLIDLVWQNKHDPCRASLDMGTMPRLLLGGREQFFFCSENEACVFLTPSWLPYPATKLWYGLDDYQFLKVYFDQRLTWEAHIHSLKDIFFCPIKVIRPMSHSTRGVDKVTVLPFLRSLFAQFLFMVARFTTLRLSRRSCGC